MQLLEYIGEFIAHRQEADQPWTFRRTRLARKYQEENPECQEDFFPLVQGERIHYDICHVDQQKRRFYASMPSPNLEKKYVRPLRRPSKVPGHPMYKVVQGLKGSVFQSPDIEECREWAQENGGGIVKIAPIAVIPPLDETFGVWVYVYARKHVDLIEGPYYFRYGRNFWYLYQGMDVMEFHVRALKASLVPWKEQRKKKRWIQISGIRRADGPGYEEEALDAHQLTCLAWFLKMGNKIRKRISGLT